MQTQPAQADVAQDEDPQLVEAMERSAAALGRAGLTAQDLLDELPSARAKVLHAAYGPAFMQKLEDQFSKAQRSAARRQPRRG